MNYVLRRFDEQLGADVYLAYRVGVGTCDVFNLEDAGLFTELEAAQMVNRYSRYNIIALRNSPYSKSNDYSEEYFN